MRRAEDSLSYLVEKDFRTAAVLHRFGIDFYRQPENTLTEACQKRKLRTELVQNAIQDAILPPCLSEKCTFEELGKLSAVQIIKYLEAQHRKFIFRKLPYMQRLISDSELFAANEPNTEILEDLRLAFPLFSEDFARHIFEEEEEMFTYIHLLREVLFSGKSYSAIYVRMEKKTITDFLIEHHAEDDDMSGIRQLTADYETGANTPLLVKVLYAELQDFERVLKFHAKVENQLLLPKALRLETAVRWLIERKTKLN